MQQERGDSGLSGMNMNATLKKSFNDDFSEAFPIGETVDAIDPNVVDWDGPADPENPKNWASGKRWSHIVLVAALGLVTYVLLSNSRAQRKRHIFRY